MEPGKAKIPNPNFGSGVVFPPGPASGAFLLHSRGNTRVEEACEMYTRAANMFKIAKNWSGESKSWDLGRCGSSQSAQTPSCELFHGEWSLCPCSSYLNTGRVDKGNELKDLGGILKCQLVILFGKPSSLSLPGSRKQRIPVHSWDRYSLFSSGRKCLLPGGQAAHAAPEQARLSHQLCGCWECLQKSRSTR